MEIKGQHPKVGQVLITPRGRYRIYTIIIKSNCFAPLTKEDVRIGLHNLRVALKKENMKSFRILIHKDLIEDLPKITILDSLKETLER